MLKEVVKVVGLHDHVVEFQERKTLFHALLIALGTQHVIYGEARAHLAQKLNIVEAQQPVGIIHHDSLALAEIDEALHLALEALSVVVDVLLGEHFSHIRAARRVADHGRAAADERDRLVACHLEAFHQRQCHKVPCRQAVSRAVKADVELGLACIDHFADLVLVRDLRQQAACLQFFVDSHGLWFLPYRIDLNFRTRRTLRAKQKRPLSRLRTEGEVIRGTTSGSPFSRKNDLTEC